MKKIIFSFLVICLLLSISCTKEFTSRFGFNCPIEKNSSGLTIMAVSNSVDFIHLEGYISVQEGEVELTLTDPEGVLVFTKHLESGENLQLQEIFEATPGIWKLKYKGSQGLSIMAVNKVVVSVYLFGNVGIDEGEIEVELIDPDGFAVYTVKLCNQEDLQVNKTFSAVPGFWKLKYKSFDGTGVINLHLNY